MLARLTRINQVLHNLLKLYPEQFAVFSTVGVIGIGLATYICATRPILKTKPYYRGRYDIVRPDEEVVLGWRVPEDYPAPYVSNRRPDSWRTIKRDYGWDLKLD